MARALAQRGHRVTMACGRFDGANTGLDGAFRRGRREGVVHGIRVVEFDIAYRNAMGLGARLLAFLHYAARATWLARAERWDLIIASSTPLTVVLPALAAPAPFIFEIRDPWPELPRAMGGVAPPLLWAMEALANAAALEQPRERRDAAIHLAALAGHPGRAWGFAPAFEEEQDCGVTHPVADHLDLTGGECCHWVARQQGGLGVHDLQPLQNEAAFVNAGAIGGDEHRQFFQRVIGWGRGIGVPGHFGLQFEGNALFEQRYPHLARIGRGGGADQPIQGG